MKKILVIMIMVLLCSTSVMAQNGKSKSRNRKAQTTSVKGWNTVNVKADELYGTRAYKMYLYEKSEGCAGFDEFGKLFIITTKGIFDYEDNRVLSSVRIGLYDKNNNLISIYRHSDYLSYNEDAYFTVSTSGSDYASCYNAVADSVIEHLQYSNGYVRIVAYRYNRVNFDIKVPCMGKKKPLKKETTVSETEEMAEMKKSLKEKQERVNKQIETQEQTNRPFSETSQANRRFYQENKSDYCAYNRQVNPVKESKLQQNPEKAKKLEEYKQNNWANL